MLHRLTGAPVAVCTDRPAAVARLAATGCVDLVIADDGLQHYAMARAFEVCVVDASAGLGNGRLLPAGPLRESANRLTEVDIIALRQAEPDRSGGRAGGALPPGVTGWPPGVARGDYRLQPEALVDIIDGGTLSLTSMSGSTVHAVAGIGRPERLFDALRAAGLHVIPHAFPDHHRYRAEELRFDDALPVITTDKDAVKLQRLGLPGRRILALRMRVELSAELSAALTKALQRSVAHFPAANSQT